MTLQPGQPGKSSVHAEPTPSVGGKTPTLTDSERQIVKQSAAWTKKYAIFGLEGKEDKALLPDEVKGATSVRALPPPPPPAPRPSRHLQCPSAQF